MSDLLPCPFCGSQAVWCCEHGEPHLCHMILCPTCKVVADFGDAVPKIDDFEEMPAFRAECAKLWNRRPSDQQKGEP